MRRLAMHHKLEPLFDKLAELFPYREPMDVVRRLEFLEDDKLGAFTQLSDAQAEVTALGKELQQQRGRQLREMTAASDAHALAMRQLSDINSDLEQELASANELVRG